ncbi:MAG: hypothetical protein RL385_523 [Pseudomonadota bacterium]
MLWTAGLFACDRPQISEATGAARSAAAAVETPSPALAAPGPSRPSPTTEAPDRGSALGDPGIVENVLSRGPEVMRCRGDSPDCRLTSPPADSEHGSPLLAADGGKLELVRSKDGRALWARRNFDDGSIYAWSFVLPQNAYGPQLLQFVDGVRRPCSDDDPKTLAPGTVHCDWDGPFQTSVTTRHPLMGEAWRIDVTERKAYPPESTATYPLIKVGKAPASPAAVGWFVFAPICKENATGCVYYGERCAVARRVAAEKGEPRELWIWPRGCGV